MFSQAFQKLSQWRMKDGYLCLPLKKQKRKFRHTKRQQPADFALSTLAKTSDELVRSNMIIVT